MARSRVYLPLRRDGLLTLQAGVLPAGAEVIAVAPGATEEREHEAWLQAADLAGTWATADGRRRIVVAADVDETAVDPIPGDHPMPGVLTVALPLKAVVSFHVDETVGSELGDLLWHDVTEIEAVRALVDAP
ncbi:MAG: hypothetical protein M9923_03850 [Phycicoccus sp.]|jgi:hypothetical protein|uniref:DUF6912 family protein n=1 Tax=Phycicoccus TaxID=367298 RepID=UPI00258D9C6D|nr:MULTISPECIES: hypothetical protein [Phycicoccus]MCO5302340.1 hypothetical protein [Phycicoccus sp.]HPF75644.1 hypothetical protein [Phycicoccus elongatus]HRV56688.1 hypothetical protein [Phycicoccus sp.]